MRYGLHQRLHQAKQRRAYPFWHGRRRASVRRGLITDTQWAQTRPRTKATAPPTQITIAWALYWLYRHPNTLRELRDEVADVEDLQALIKLPLLDAVVNETLRIDPIVPDVLRTLTVDKIIGGYHYPKGSHLAVVTALLHSREDLYPDPDEFKPHRWLDQRPRPWTFFPFGGGARRCIGSALAIAEVKIVITEVIQSLDLEIKAEERSARVNIIMAPKHGVKAFAKPLSP